MGNDGLKVGIQIRKFVIITIKLCYRSVCNHPFVVGLLLFLLYLHRSYPFLFSILVSTSPVLVGTAVLLGTLLSFGEQNVVPECEEEEKPAHEVVQSKTGGFESTTVVEEDECFGKDSRYTELSREFVKTTDEEPLLDNTDRLDKLEIDRDDDDVAYSTISTDHNSTEVIFEKGWIDEPKSEQGNAEIEQAVDLGDQMFKMGIIVGFSDGEILETRFSSVEKVQGEHFEDYISAEGSIDAQMGEYLVSSLESQKQLNEVLADSILSAKEVQHENFEDYKSAEGSVDVQLGDQLEPSLASWKQFDSLDDRLSTALEVQEKRFEGYNIAEGSSEAQLRDYLESSMRSWRQMGSDHDEHGESDSGSDGAESSSPDASMADIIPMLDELDPLLDDEILQASNLSHQSSAATMDESVVSPDSSIHSDDESDHKDHKADEGKSDNDDDNEEETQVGKEDSAKSAITWTEDDQKNLMDLGTSELERNQRLESLIARRRARKITGDRNLIDLDGMDLPFPVAPISTRRNNPFDLPQDNSYADLGLPPIPGSAPSIMLSRRNPFDLPYDSSEEKPDLSKDTFQQEFTEVTQREALFRRNETFNMGSTGFDLGRPSRFRPYFVPERTDSDMMSYSSLSRQVSELSESKASSVSETESTSAGADQEEKKLIEHDSAQEVEPSSEVDYASVLVEHGSQSSADLDSLLGEEQEKKDFVPRELEVELGRERSSPTVDSDVMGYPSLQRQLSEYSESKESTAAEKESTSAGADLEEKIMEYNSAQEVEARFEIDHASALLEHGSQSSEDLDSLSDDEIDRKDFVLSVLEVELGRAKSSSAAASYTSETIESADNRIDYREISPAVDPLLSHSKVSHSDIQPVTELIEVNHNITSRPLSVSKVFNDGTMEDVDRGLANKEKRQLNNLFNVHISEKCSLEPSSSGVTSGLSLETSEYSHAAEVDDNHPREPIYDFSPLKKNHSLSSSSSDMQRETSGIDLYHLSSDLFVVDETNVHNQDVEFISQQTKKDADGDDLTMNDIGEQSGVYGTDFSEFNQLPSNSLTSVVAEGEVHLAKDKISGDEVAPHEVENFFAQKDGSEIHIENKLDDMPSADRHKFAEDSILAQEKKEVTTLADNYSPVHSTLSSSQVESKDENQEEVNISQQFQVSYSSLKSRENDGNETLEFSLDENHFFPHNSDISDPWADSADQERSVILRKLEVDQANKIDDPANVLLVKEPQHEISSDPSQSNVSSSQPEDSETTVAELSFKKHVQDLPGTGLTYTVEENHEVFEGYEEPIADEHITYAKKNDVNEMDDELLSELDAVGDFGVSNTVSILENSMIDLNAAIDSNLPVEAFDEVYTSTEMPIGHETLLGDSTHVEINPSRIKESNLDSQTVNLNTDLLNLEAHSVEDTDAVFAKASDEVHKSVVAESVQAEFMGEVDGLFPETDLLLGDTEPRGSTSEVVTNTADNAFNSRESVSERIESDLAFLEGHDLDPHWNETISGLPIVDAKIIKQSAADVEKVEEEIIDKSDYVEALPKVSETGVDSLESMPLQIHRDIKEIDDSSVIEASTAPDLEPIDQTESIGSMESESSLIDRDIKEIQEPLVLDESDSLVHEFEDKAPEMHVLGASIAPAVKSEIQTDRKTHEPLLLGKEDKELKESLLVGVSVGSALDTEDQMEKFNSTRSESLHIDEEVEETEELLAHEGSIAPASESDDQRDKISSSEPLQLDRDIVQESPAVEANIPSGLQPEEREVVGYKESEPLQLHRDIHEVQESPAVEESIPSALQPEETEVVEESEPLQLDRDIHEVQEFPAVEERIPSALHPEEREVVGSEESEPLHLDRDIQEVQESPAIEASIPSALQPEEREVVGSDNSEPLQSDNIAEELRDWHVVEGIAPMESKPIQTETDIKDVPESPTAQASFFVPESSDQILTVDSGESRLLLINRNVGELQELPAVEEKIAPENESGQLEKVSFVESESLQMDGDFEEIQEPPFLHNNCASAVQFKDQMEINSPMEVVEVQALQDHHPVSQQEREVDLSNMDDSRGLIVDSSTTDIQSIKNEVGGQGHDKNAAENFSSQVEEEKSS
ncbi:uncharacterized protein LOC110699490 [Chenopodium quinoa]|uniref:uncharacterized protein LOC110699490 n=1 Tax=Chenopodium quinoa TaxID=63459 RepID=UPI000B76E413|nr:uncharacterized protein LOC110699490 [Chenopodium quinoa]